MCQTCSETTLLIFPRGGSFLFIFSGLTLAVGIIFYISAINDEVGHRSKVKDGKKFTYEYGWSFVFAGIAFVITEVTAVVFVTLYMQRNSSRDDLVRIIPGLEDKFEDDQNEAEEQAGTSNPTIIL